MVRTSMNLSKIGGDIQLVTLGIIFCFYMYLLTNLLYYYNGQHSKYII